MSGTVYLIAQPTVKRDGRLPDLTPAAAFGPIKVLIEAGEYPTFNPERCLAIITERLKHFNAEKDYIVWAGGDTLSAVLVGNVLAELGVEEVWWLRFERGRDGDGRRTDAGGIYTPIKVPLWIPAMRKVADERQLELELVDDRT